MYEIWKTTVQKADGTAKVQVINNNGTIEVRSTLNNQHHDTVVHTGERDAMASAISLGERLRSSTRSLKDSLDAGMQVVREAEARRLTGDVPEYDDPTVFEEDRLPADPGSESE